MYIMQGTFSICECESTLLPLTFRSLKQEEFEGAMLDTVKMLKAAHGQGPSYTAGAVFKWL